MKSKIAVTFIKVDGEVKTILDSVTCPLVDGEYATVQVPHGLLTENKDVIISVCLLEDKL